MLKVAMPYGGSANDQGAIGHGLGDGRKFFCVLKDVSCADGGAGALKRYVVGVDDAETGKSKIAHRPGSGADIERISRVDKHDAQVGEFSERRQCVLILRQRESGKWAPGR